MRQLRSIGFIIVVSVLSAITYGGLYSKAPVSGQDAYQPTPASSSSTTITKAHQHPGTPIFRYYKRYMEKSQGVVYLPGVVVSSFSLYKEFAPLLFPATNSGLQRGIHLHTASRGPPCLG